MSAVLRALVWNEVRLRMRRTSTVVALLALVVASWLMIPDPHTGMSLMTVRDARVLYTSTAIAFGSAALGSLLFGLAGFYLVRGRVGEDLRSGIGSVIAATPVGNALFLFSRWLGGVVYLAALVVVFMATMLVLHLLRGEAPIALWVYAQMYALMLLPLVLCTASCAILFDSFAPLMGKGGDVLYFFLWAAQLSVMAVVDGLKPGEFSPLMVFDFSGMTLVAAGLRDLLHTNEISVGISDFKAALAPVTLPDALWSPAMVGMRAVSALLALVPLLPAVALFHRFSPDSVRQSRMRARRSPIAFLNRWVRPLSLLVRPLFALAARLPGVSGQVAADIALTMAASPLFIALLIGLAVAECLAPARALGGLCIAAVAAWGLLVADVSTRDFQATSEDMTGAVPGGIARRYLRQAAATAMLGLMFTGVAALRWSGAAPMRALAVLAGVASLSALASLFGRTSRTSRTFIALFLFWLYVACNAVTVPMLDAVGFNGVANAVSVGLQAAVAALALIAGVAYNRQRAL